MNVLKLLSPRYTPARFAGKSDLRTMREKILQAMLLAVAVTGIPTVVLASIESIQAQQYWLPVLYAGIYLLFLSMIFFRSLPYSLRAYVLVSVIYLLAISELFETGLLGDVRMFLIAFAALVAVLFDYRNVIAAVLLGLVTIVGAGLYATLAPDLAFPAFANVLLGSSWITSSVTFLMISTVITGAISMIISGLDTNLKKQAELAHSLENERTTLEDRIHKRTRSMTQHLNQLRTASEISRAISALGDPEKLLQQVADLIKDRFDLYYVGVFLMDSSRQYAVLRVGTGEAGKRMVAQGHQLAVGGSSMIGWAIANRKARIALDVGAEAVRFSNPNLPFTRSEMALPIITRDTVLGALSIQSEKPNAFDENDITILESITDSLAIALENDRLYHETRKSLEEIRTLNREYLQRGWAETIETYGELSYEFENQENDPGPLVMHGNMIEVPLLLRDEVIGTVTLEVDQPALTEEQTAFIENVTTETAIALENARLLHETERRAIQEQKLNELASRFARALNIDEILRAAAQELGQLPTVAEVSVQLNPASASRHSEAAPGWSGRNNGKEHGA